MAAITSVLIWAALVLWGFVTAVVIVLLVVSAIADARDRRRARCRRLAESAFDWSVEVEFVRQLAELSHVPDDWT